jgi:hypothetical protein
MKHLFDQCLGGPWKTAGIDTQYKIIEGENEITLAFEGSSSFQDWRDNFAIPVRPYRAMPIGWLAHGGFVRAWKRAEDQISSELRAVIQSRRLRITGYSHGSALAILAHEYFTFHGFRPETIAFASPRVLWLPPKRIKERFKKLTLVMCRGDIVTHLPPQLLGYRSIGNTIRIGPWRIISHFAHYPKAYISALKELLA